MRELFGVPGNGSEGWRVAHKQSQGGEFNQNKPLQILGIPCRNMAPFLERCFLPSQNPQARQLPPAPAARQIAQETNEEPPMKRVPAASRVGPEGPFSFLSYQSISIRRETL